MYKINNSIFYRYDKKPLTFSFSRRKKIDGNSIKLSHYIFIIPCSHSVEGYNSIRIDFIRNLCGNLNVKCVS